MRQVLLSSRASLSPAPSVTLPHTRKVRSRRPRSFRVRGPRSARWLAGWLAFRVLVRPALCPRSCFGPCAAPRRCPSLPHAASGRCGTRTHGLLVVSHRGFNGVLTWENAGYSRAQMA